MDFLKHIAFPQSLEHIALLHLNRAALVAFRLQRRYYGLLLERRRLVEAENTELRAIVKAQEKYIAHLKTLIEGQADEHGR